MAIFNSYVKLPEGIFGSFLEKREGGAQMFVALLKRSGSFIEVGLSPPSS
jgi:hypothetical protein